MGDVRALAGHSIPLPSGEIDQEIVNILEILLEKARNGQLRAFAHCTYTCVDTITHGWHRGGYGFHLAAAVSLLDQAYHSDLNGQE